MLSKQQVFQVGYVAKLPQVSTLSVRKSYGINDLKALWYSRICMHSFDEHMSV